MKVVVVQSDTRTSWRNDWMKLNEASCARLGVDYYLGSKDPVNPPQGSWCKPFLAKKLLADYDYVIWLDSDAVIISSSILSLLDKDKVVLSQNPPYKGWKKVVNTGCVIIPKSRLDVVEAWCSKYNPEYWTYTGTNWDLKEPTHWGHGPGCDQGELENISIWNSNLFKVLDSNVLACGRLPWATKETVVIHHYGHSSQPPDADLTAAIAARTRLVMPIAEAILPYHPGNSHRRTNLELILAYYTQLNIPVVLAEIAPAPTASGLASDKVRYCYSQQTKPFNAGHGFNLGVANSTKSKLILADSDAWLPLAAIEQGLAGLDSADLILGGTNLINLERAKALPYLEEVAISGKFSPELAMSFRNLVRPNPFGCTRFVTRKSYLRVGGFHPGFTGWGAEDDELVVKMLKLDYKVGAIPGDMFHLGHATSTLDMSYVTANYKLLNKIKSMSKQDLANYYYNLEYISEGPVIVSDAEVAEFSKQWNSAKPAWTTPS